MKNNFFTNLILIVLITIGIYGAVAYLNIYSRQKDAVFESKLPPATPMSILPLQITKKFGLHKTSESLYYYGGSIYNSSNDEITIEELRYTFEHKMNTCVQATVETNIRIPPKTTYTLYDPTQAIVYLDNQIVDYAYVQITVNGQEQYLYHENYQSIIDAHNKLLDNEKEEFNQKIQQPLKMSIAYIIFAGIISIFLISGFIVKKNKSPETNNYSYLNRNYKIK